MSGDKCLKIHMALNVWRQMSGVKCLTHQNGRQMSWHQISQQSNVLALNVFDIKSLEVKHLASNVWATNVIGVKQLEPEQQTVSVSSTFKDFYTLYEFGNFDAYLLNINKHNKNLCRSTQLISNQFRNKQLFFFPTF